MNLPLMLTQWLLMRQGIPFPAAVCGLTRLRRLTLSTMEPEGFRFTHGLPREMRRLSLLEDLRLDIQAGANALCKPRHWPYPNPNPTRTLNLTLTLTLTLVLMLTLTSTRAATSGLSLGSRQAISCGCLLDHVFRDTVKSVQKYLLLTPTGKSSPSVCLGKGLAEVMSALNLEGADARLATLADPDAAAVGGESDSARETTVTLADFHSLRSAKVTYPVPLLFDDMTGYFLALERDSCM